MMGGFAAFSTIWMFPIPEFLLPSVLLKVAGIGTFGFGVGSICHYITKNGPGELDLIAIWRN